MPWCGVRGRAISNSLPRRAGGGIERAIRHRQKAEHGADVDDATTPLASHMRHDGARHPDKAEEVRFEDRSSLTERALSAPAGATPKPALFTSRSIRPWRRITSLTAASTDRRGHVEGQHRTIVCLLGSPSAGAVDLVASFASRSAVASPMPTKRR